MGVKQAFNYQAISDKVCTAGLLSEEQLDCLGPEGYQVVINLLPDDNEYAIANEKAIVENQGIDYHAIPVDFSAPKTADYRQFCDLLNRLNEQKILIHCAANYRVSAFYSRYAIQHLGWTRHQADELVASIWNPEEDQVWKRFLAELT